jgi:hypothetical protein
MDFYAFFAVHNCRKHCWIDSAVGGTNVDVLSGKKNDQNPFFINLSTQKFIWRNVKAAAERAVD